MTNALSISFNDIYQKLELAITKNGPLSILPNDYGYFPILIIPATICIFLLARKRNYFEIFMGSLILTMSLMMGIMGDAYYRAWWPAQAFILTISMAAVFLSFNKSCKTLIAYFSIFFMVTLNSLYLDSFVYERERELVFLENASIRSISHLDENQIHKSNFIIQLPNNAAPGGGALSQEKLCTRAPCTGWGDFSMRVSSSAYWGISDDGWVSGYATNYLLYIAKKYNWPIQRGQIKEIDPKLPKIKSGILDPNAISIDFGEIEKYYMLQPISRGKFYLIFPIIFSALLTSLTLLLLIYVDIFQRKKSVQF
jgi:hypothetical protein